MSAARPTLRTSEETTMSRSNLSDGTADAIAATAIIAVVTLGMYIWLSGRPG